MCSTFKSRTQAFPATACCTVLFFFLLKAKIVGAKSFGQIPSNHAKCQNKAFAPFPIVILVSALKSLLSVLVQGISIPTQGLFSDFHDCHSQRSCNAVKIYRYQALQDHLILLVGASVSKPLCISLQLAVFRPSIGSSVVWHPVP